MKTLNHGVHPANRYSAKNMMKPVTFFINAPNAESVFLVGDFNDWQRGVSAMKRQPDGSWSVQVPLHHGHHCYHFLVDGEIQLDLYAQGITRNERGEHVSIMAVS